MLYYNILAYKLEGEEAKEAGLENQYILMRKVDEGIWWPGHIVPIVYFQVTTDYKLPTTYEELENLQCLQTSVSYIVTRNGKVKVKYYRERMISTSKRVIPSKKLIYVGNFKNLPTPNDEYVPEDSINIGVCRWADLEKEMALIYNLYHKK